MTAVFCVLEFTVLRGVSVFVRIIRRRVHENSPLIPAHLSDGHYSIWKHSSNKWLGILSNMLLFYLIQSRKIEKKNPQILYLLPYSRVITLELKKRLKWRPSHNLLSQRIKQHINARFRNIVRAVIAKQWDTAHALDIQPVINFYNWKYYWMKCAFNLAHIPRLIIHHCNKIWLTRPACVCVFFFL